MANSYKSSKLFNIEDRKRHTGKPTTEVDIFQWRSTLLEELRKNDQFTDHLKNTATWKPPKHDNRGFVGADAEKKAKQVDDMLTKIASYSPSCLVRAISKRTTCLEDIWALVRDWAGIQTTGSRHLNYYRVKHSWKPDDEESKQEFFYRLKDSMEDTLIMASDNIAEDGRRISEDEDMTPCINSTVVMDWIEAIGGAPLVEHVHRVYAKDLETATLGSLQSRISKNLDSLIHEIDEQQQAQINRVFHQTPSRQAPRSGSLRRPQPSAPGYPPFPSSPAMTKRPPQSSSRSPVPPFSSPLPTTPRSRSVYCKLCRSQTDHFISACPHLSQADRNQIAKARWTSNILPEEEETTEYEAGDEVNETEVVDQEDSFPHQNQD